MKKYKLYSFFSFFFLICLFTFVSAKTVKEPLYQKTIFLDAGHGGPDSGALYKNIYEKDINLSIVKKLEKQLKEKGATVFLTRDGDYDLSVPYTMSSTFVSVLVITEFAAASSSTFTVMLFALMVDCLKYLSVTLK